MTVRKLVEQLEKLAKEHSWDCEVVVLDGEGEWPFAVKAEPEMMSDMLKMVVCLDITAAPDDAAAEQ